MIANLNLTTRLKELSGLIKKALLTLYFVTILLFKASAQDAGRTISSLDVSPSGAATYSVPISVPPGINGVVPQVALTYNSQSGDGVAGFGWNVSGVSTITRVAATRYHDNRIGLVNYDTNDRFALDGQRLILKSGTYGAAESIYETENFSNLKIVAKGTRASGPEYFEVHYPDGSYAEYGSTPTSKMLTTYAISFMRNPQDIRINYNYFLADNSIQISNINYGSKGATNGINQITFNYATRSFKETGYVGGTFVMNSMILQSISVTGNGTNFRNYILTHDEVLDLKYQRITSIQEVNGDNSKSFAPITFSYNPANADITVGSPIPNINPGSIASSSADIIVADFTGNGKLDMVIYPKSKDKIYTLWDPKAASPSSTKGIEYSTGSFWDIHSATVLSAANKIEPARAFVLIKDEGANHINFEVRGAVTSSGSSVKLYDRDWTNVPIDPDFYSNCYDSTYPNPAIPRRFLSGDFNGDGLTDIVSISKPHSYIIAQEPPYPGDPGCEDRFAQNNVATVHFINLDRRITSNFVHSAGSFTWGTSGRDDLYTGDFNGDGKTDILRIDNGVMTVYQLDDNNNLQSLWSKPHSRVITTYAPFLGDYNGDGKTDVIFPTTATWPGADTFAIFMSTGFDFAHQDKAMPFSFAIPSVSGSTLTTPFIIPADINSDGKTDFILANSITTQANSTGNAAITIYNNVGVSSGSSGPEFILGKYKYESGLNLSHYPIPVFFDSQNPNFDQEFGLLSGNTLSLFNYGKDVKNETQATSITQDGVVQYVDYKKLISGPGIPNYSGANTQIFPYVDISSAPGTVVVDKLRRVFGTDEVQQTFGYKSAVTHLHGLGFMGFGEIVRSNWHTGNGDANRIFTITITDPQLRGAVIKQFTAKNTNAGGAIITDVQAPVADITLNTPPSSGTVIASNSIVMTDGFSYNGANGPWTGKIADPKAGVDDDATISDYITRVDYKYKTELLPSKVYINVPLSISTKNLLDGTNTLSTFTYDSYYNVTDKFTNFSGDGSVMESVTYVNNPGAGYIGRVSKNRTTKTVDGDSFSTEENFTTYANSLPKQIKRKGNGTSEITEDIAYDIYGNVITKTTSNATGTRVVSMEYDATHRFATKVTDVEGMETNSTYNSSNGNLITSTNPFGQTTTYAYDSWGRPIQVTDYLGKNSYKTYARDGSKIVITETNDQGGEKTSTSNAVGKLIKVVARDVMGQMVRVDHQYDVYDREVKVSEPSLSSPSQWNETEYDAYGRVKKISQYTGKITDLSYDGLITTVNDGVKTVKTTKNALGNVVRTEDPGGTINHTYFGNGNLKSSDLAGSTQTITQDGWGRKTSLTDPSAGVYTYTYNEFGEILTETTPKGSTQYTYDIPTGKLTQKKVTGDGIAMTSGYDYDLTTKQLKKITVTNVGTINRSGSYEYFYDSNKRLRETIESNDLAIFTKTLTYDAFGRVATETSKAENLSNSVSVTKALLNTYQYGDLKSISDNATGQSIWEVTAQNARGQVTTALLGAALKQSNTFDGYGLPQQFKTEKVSGGSPVELMNLTFDFNPQRGNLAYRSNNAFGTLISESFVYDNQDRLTKISANGVIQDMAYDGRGRITSSSELGSYTYTGTSYQQTELTGMTTAALAYYQSRQLQQIVYNAIKKPVSINEEGKERINFMYNAFEGRAHMYYGNTQTQIDQRKFRRDYSADGSMEITEEVGTGKVDFVFYLGGDAYSAPAIWKQERTPSTNTGKLYYLHRDYLGSILMITDVDGTVHEKRHFDAWGNIAKLTDGSNNDITAFAILDRGYTGHEHLQGVGLINMNGRLYDPKLHRFLSPDNFVQDPNNSQSYNRYGYVLNNPLRYTDPSGEAFWIPALMWLAKTATVAITGAAIAATSYTASVAFSDGGFSNWNTGQFLRSVTIGAISAVVTGGIGSHFGSIGSVGHELLRAGAHGLANGIISGISGGNFIDGFLSGAVGSLAGSGFQSLGGFARTGVGTIGFSAISGGIAADLSGGSFWEGARNAAIVAGLNHMTHVEGDDPKQKSRNGSGPPQPRKGTTADEDYDLLSKVTVVAGGAAEAFDKSQLGKISRVGRVANAGLFAIGVFTDGVRWLTDPNFTSAKFATNTGFGLLGFYKYGMPISAIYFGVDAFYPGGWSGLRYDASNQWNHVKYETLKGVVRYNSSPNW